MLLHPLDTMSKERWVELEKHRLLNLTPKEVEDGYRFCCEWDGLLIHASHPEADCCSCLKPWRVEHGLASPEVETVEGDSVDLGDLMG